MHVIQKLHVAAVDTNDKEQWLDHNMFTFAPGNC